jgi:hypothetical protein
MSERDLTTEERERCFRLLDGYSRSKHNCFVSEFFLSTQTGNYVVCFRPVSVTVDDQLNDPNGYTCKYAHFEAALVREMAKRPSLPPTMESTLATALKALSP